MTRPCAQIASVLDEVDTLAFYPACSSFLDGSNPDVRVIVEGDFASQNPLELGAALAIPFGAAGWLSLLLHTIAIETYVSIHNCMNALVMRQQADYPTVQLRLTPIESDRLRQVSYERQLERGSTRPGYAGLTVERFGDARPYVPLRANEEKE